MSAGDSFLDTLETLLAAESVTDLETTLISALADQGFQNLAYCSLSDFHRTGDPAALMKVLTFPEEWIRYYADRGYEEIDPVFHFGQVCRRPFDWREVLTVSDFTKKQREMIHEAGAVGMSHGLTVPIFGPGGDHAILSGSHVEKARPTDRPGLAFQIIAQQFHQRYQMLTRGDDTAAPVHVSPRERETLLWTARGKTSWEIGQILHLATRSVDHYVESAMQKLGVNTRVAAVVKAIYLGIIYP